MRGVVNLILPVSILIHVLFLSLRVECTDSPSVAEQLGSLQRINA
jgi:hypothetical protein